MTSIDREGFKIVLDRLAHVRMTLTGLKFQVKEGVFNRDQYVTLESKVRDIIKVAEEIMELIEGRLYPRVEAPSIKKWLKQVEGYE